MTSICQTFTVETSLLNLGIITFELFLPVPTLAFRKPGPKPHPQSGFVDATNAIIKSHPDYQLSGGR
jgi:hypothetical protein